MEFSVARARELETARGRLRRVLVSLFCAFLRDAIDHRAIRRHEILRRRCFDLRRRDVLEGRQERVDLLRVVAEQGESGQ